MIPLLFIDSIVLPIQTQLFHNPWAFMIDLLPDGSAYLSYLRYRCFSLDQLDLSWHQLEHFLICVYKSQVMVSKCLFVCEHN